MDTIVLIGMPNSGKTSVGRRLATDMKKKFIDTDELITNTINETPRQIVKDKGEGTFLKMQQDILMDMDTKSAIIATGGSVIYSPKLMSYLKEKGCIIYLNESIEALLNRMTKGRRIIGSKYNDFEKLYKERDILYKKYACKEIDCANKSIQKIVEEIKTEVQNNE